MQVTKYCGGPDNVAAKGGFRLKDGTELYWACTRKSRWHGTDEKTDADHGIRIVREDMGNMLAMDEITASCEDAVEIIA